MDISMYRDPLMIASSILFIFALVFVACDTKSSKFNDGDLVRIKLSGEVGMVIGQFGTRTQVRFKDHSVRGFEDYELAKEP